MSNGIPLNELAVCLCVLWPIWERDSVLASGSSSLIAALICGHRVVTLRARTMISSDCEFQRIAKRIGNARRMQASQVFSEENAGKHSPNIMLSDFTRSDMALFSFISNPFRHSEHFESQLGLKFQTSISCQ